MSMKISIRYISENIYLAKYFGLNLCLEIEKQMIEMNDTDFYRSPEGLSLTTLLIMKFKHKLIPTNYDFKLFTNCKKLFLSNCINYFGFFLAFDLNWKS